MKHLLVRPEIIWAFVTAVFYGIAGPLTKLAFNFGMTPEGITIIYGFSLIAAGVVSASIRESVTASNCFPNVHSLLFGVLAGIVCATGFLSSSHSINADGSRLSVVVGIFALYPMITVFAGLVLFREAQHVLLPRLLTGVGLAAAAGYLIITSIKLPN